MREILSCKAGPLTACSGPRIIEVHRGEAMPFPRGLVCVVLGLALLAACGNNTPTTDTKATSAQVSAAPSPAQSPVERGKYIVTIGGCNDCHTPKKLGPNGPEPDM